MLNGMRSMSELEPAEHALGEAGDGVLEPTRGDIAPGWVTKVRADKAEYKEALARYVTTHFVRYGMVLFMGPGTTNNILADTIFDVQVDSRSPLDLAILTNNLTI